MRGQTQVSLITMLEALLVVAVILAGVFILYKLSPAFRTTTNKQTTDAYDHILRNIDRMLETGKAEHRSLFQFNERDDFKGTIYAINKDGTLSDPFPPLFSGIKGTATDHYTPQIERLLDEAKLDRAVQPLLKNRCKDTACLCFTKKALPVFDTADFNRGVEAEVFTKVYTYKADCTSYEDITFDIQAFTTPFDQTLGIVTAGNVHDLILTQDGSTMSIALGIVS